MYKVRRLLLVVTLLGAVAVALTVRLCCIASSASPSSDLIEAAWKGEVVRVRELLEKGIDPNVRQRHMRQMTPLIAAVFSAGSNRHEVVQELLRHGADPNMTDVSGLTALVWAVRNVDVESAEMLVRYGADLRGPAGESPIDFLEAKRRRHPAKAAQIMSAIANRTNRPAILVP